MALDVSSIISAVVPADHPALPGHFPGQPVVPGVLLLALVSDHAREQLHFRAGACTWTRIKFMRSVLPEQCFKISLRGNPVQFEFTILSLTDENIATGRCGSDALA